MLNKRSWIKQSAYKSGSGIHKNKNKRRRNNKAEVLKKIIKEQTE